jgi:hypothetical protein
MRFLYDDLLLARGHCETTTSTHSASPDSMCLSKPNPIEPPWYETRMPGGGGGVAREVSPYSDHRRRAVMAMRIGMGQARYRESSASIAAAFSPIMIVGACVQAFSAAGMTEASATRSPCSPVTRKRGSTTAVGSLPMRHVLLG